MEFVLVGVIAVLTIVAATVFAKPLGVAAPLLLAVIGIGCSFLPGLPAIRVPPQLILEVVLPALLYAAAIRVPLVDFRRNLGSIFGLSVMLVVVTAFGVGFLLHAIVPGLGLGAAVALGAVVSPTDAVAATSIGKKLGLPPKLLTLLEGESLVNDASSLVLLKSALAAAGVTASMADIGGDIRDFAFSVIVAIVIGLVVGAITVFIRSKIKDPVVDTAVSLAVPFIAYIPVELLGASGIIAVVVVGIYSGHNGARYFSARSRLSERMNWSMIQFILENGVFLLMGLQLVTIVREDMRAGFGVLVAVLLGLGVVVVLLVIRMLFVAPLVWRLRRSAHMAERGIARIERMIELMQSRFRGSEERAARRKAQAERNLQRRSADLTAMREESIGIRGGIVLTWAGMRGVVTLAAAQSVPVDVPLRPELILIAFTVAITTLLVQGGTLPWVIRLSGIRGSDVIADRRTLATLMDEIGEAGMDVLENPASHLATEESIDDAVVSRLRKDTMLRSESAWESVERSEGGDDGTQDPRQQYWALQREILRAERLALLYARDQGRYPSRVLVRAQAILDMEEARLAQGDAI